jgi:sugar phosphate permease
MQTFAFTWTAYASIYLNRKNLSVVKDSLVEEHGLTNAQLGAIDTGYLVAYSIGQFTSGFLGDRIGGKRLVGIGLIATAALNMAFGAGQSFLFFLIPWVLNGFAQSTGWPGCAKTFSRWFARGERGTVMGIWLTCYQVGPLVATLLATWLMVAYGWEMAFFGPALLVAGFGLLFLKSQPRSPEQVGLPHVEQYYSEVSDDHEKQGEESGDEEADSEVDSEEGPSNLRLVLTSRPIWTLGLSYVVLKFVRYSLLFWLPLYMTQSLGYRRGEAGYTSVAFDVAGILGVILAGVVSDRVFKSRRAPVVVIMMAALAVATYAFPHFSALGRMENIIAIGVIGFLLYGPDSITAGVAAVDFGKTKAASLAAGFVNGVGSIGGALSGVVVGYVSQQYGWDGVFSLFAPLCAAGALLMATLWNKTAD